MLEESLVDDHEDSDEDHSKLLNLEGDEDGVFSLTMIAVTWILMPVIGRGCVGRGLGIYRDASQ